MSMIKKQGRALHYIIKIALLSAIAAIIMLFELPLWFAPSFYKLDISEAVILMGSFAMGPVAGVVIELLKNLLNIVLNGTTTAYVGELANFVTGCAFVLPAALMYKYQKTQKGALIGMCFGTACLAVVGSLINYFVLVPTYSSLYGLPIDSIVDMAKAVNPLIGDLKTMIAFAVAPFNLLKGIVCSVLSLLLYKRLSKLLHK